MGAFTILTSKGQLTIPKDVRDALNLTAGTKFYVTVRNGEVVALPRNKRLADLAGILGKPPSGEMLTIAEMRHAVMETAAEDDERIYRQQPEARK
jgi:antitoxin PrlF